MASAKTRAEDIIREAKERLRTTQAVERELRAKIAEDLDFYQGKQWPKEWSDIRTKDARPIVTMNRIPQFVKQVTNEQRSNRPSPIVIPTKDATEETADVLEGLLRRVISDAESEAAITTAMFNETALGIGYVRVNLDYCNDESFDLDIKLERVLDPLTVFFDSDCLNTVYKDAKWCMVLHRKALEDVQDEHGDKITAANDFAPDQVTPDDGDRVMIWIAEYYKVKTSKTKIYRTTRGEVLKEIPEGFENTGNKTYFNAQTGESFVVLEEREVEKRKVMRYILSGDQILEEEEWEGQYIPIIPFIGDETCYMGKKDVKGIIRDIKEPQRGYNCMVSAQYEGIALSPKATFIAAAGQIEDNIDDWKNINTRSLSVITYSPVDVRGNLLPPPQRAHFEPPIQAITIALQQASQDLKNITGIYDASMGAQSNETSGKAILARQQQGNNANYNFMDSAKRSMRYLGEVIVDLMLRIYTTPQVVRIVQPNMETKLVKINQMFTDKNEAKIYDLTKGRYDVDIDTGPSFLTKRSEAANTMVELSRAYPDLWRVAGDLIASNMDVAGAKEIAERLKRTIPPQLLGEEEENPQMMAQKLQAMAQQHEQLTQALQQMNDKLNSKQDEIQSREKIATQNNLVRLMEKEMDNNKHLFMADFNQKVNLLKNSVQNSMPQENSSL